MLFGWGFKTYKKYGIINIGVCNHCQKNSQWMLVKETVWFNIFFIPIIPIRVRKLIVCVNCNYQKEIDSEVFEKLKNMLEKKKTATMSTVTSNVRNAYLTETQRNYLNQIRKIQEEKELMENKSDIKAINELNLIRRSKIPYSRELIAEDLRKLGLKKGMTVVVHTSLSSIGWIAGGPVALIQALMDVITNEGTLVMPAHSGDYSDPASWENPPVPEEWVDIIKEHMPAFHPRYSPTRGLGRVPEIFRTFPEVLRSNHPLVSFTAWGKHAEAIVSSHSIEYSLGESSPLRKIYDLNGSVLMIGTDYDTNTSFHLSEYRTQNSKEETVGAPIFVEGKRKWETFKDIEMSTEDFIEIGKAFEQSNSILIGKVGNATVKLLNQKEAVDFATKWMDSNRK